MKKQSMAYLRLSLADDDEKDESNSISSQRKCIKDYCKKHNLEQNYSECVDDGYSGTNFNRPGFQKMLLLVRAGSIDTILVKDLSRLGRNYLEVGYYLEYVFPYYNVRIIAINDNFDSEKAGETALGLEVAIRNLMNECYSRDISKKISSAVHIKKMEGKYVYGAVPFGYKKGNEKNTIVIDEEAAKIVRYVFKLAISGTTVSQIARRLNKEQVITPSKYLSSIRPNYKVSEHWSYESVRNLLSNRIYTGDTETYKSHVVKVGSDNVKQIPEKDRVVVENTHTAIISREEYNEARKVIKSNVKSPKKTVSSPLTGILFCGCCGGRLTKGKSANRYFLCANARYMPESGCKSVRAEEKRTKEVLSKAIDTQVSLFHEKKREVEKLIKIEESQMLQLQREQKKVSDKRNKLMDEKLFLYEEYVAGKLSKESYLKNKEEMAALESDLARQEAVLAEKMAKLEEDSQRNTSHEQEKSDILDIKPEMELSQDLVKSLIKKVVVRQDNEVEIYWDFMDEMKMEGAGNEQ